MLSMQIRNLYICRAQSVMSLKESSCVLHCQFYGSNFDVTKCGSALKEAMHCPEFCFCKYGNPNTLFFRKLLRQKIESPTFELRHDFPLYHSPSINLNHVKA